MAQWWHASVVHKHPHQHVTTYSSLQTCTRITWRSFLSPAGWECLIVPKSTPDFSISDMLIPSAPAAPTISCFCDDDPLVTEHFFNKDGSTLTLRTKLEIMYSPWAMSMMNGYQTPMRKSIKESTGGPTGGGRGGDGDGGGDGGGGGGDEGKEEQVWILPFLTIAFAAFHLGYCIAILMKDEAFDFEFFRTGVGLFCLLAVAAIRLNNRSGVDAYLLGLGASVGVMLWTDTHTQTGRAWKLQGSAGLPNEGNISWLLVPRERLSGERCLVKKEGSPAGIVSFFAGAMAALFSTALHETMRRHF